MITQKLNASYARSISIEIPTYFNTYPVLMLPTNKSVPDCPCPVFIDPVHNGSCVDLSSCYCVNRLSIPNLLRSINICNSTKGTLQVYFQNLTRQLNGTRFHLCYNYGGNGEPYYRIYFSSFEIFEGKLHTFFNFAVQFLPELL